MAKTVIMPKLGLTMTEGTVVSWRKHEGDTVSVGDVVCEVSTDKLTNEVTAEDNGVLLKIVVEEGQTVPVQDVLGIIGAAGEDISSLLGGAPAASVTNTAEAPATPAAEKASVSGERILAAPAAKKRAKELGIDIALVVPSGKRITIDDVEKYYAAAQAKAKPAVPKATPMAKIEAAAAGVDLADVPAKGRIKRTDVQTFVNGSKATAPEAAVSAAETADEEIVPMSMMRKVIAKRMRESVDISPTVTYNVSVDMTALAALRQSLKPYRKVTYTDLLVLIVSQALLEFPMVNCSIEGDNMILKHYVNMGVAVAVENGLVVPVIKNAHKMGLTAISEVIADYAAKAKSNTLSPDAMSGGTFTITNLGMFGMESFSPIINQPEVAILGVNAIHDVLYLKDGAVCSKPMMTLSLTADHRAVDGAVAAQFLQKVRSVMEAPGQLLL